MQTIIQLIETQWTKQSRSAPAARVRNSIPERLPIPDTSLSNSVLLQHVVYAEHAHFLPEQAEIVCFSTNDEKKWRISITQFERAAEIKFYGTPFTEMSGRATDKMVLESNSWLQIIANRRISEDEGGWAYRKYVYNIVFGRTSNASLLLASSAPVARLNIESHLW